MQCDRIQCNVLRSNAVLSPFQRQWSKMVRPFGTRRHPFPNPWEEDRTLSPPSEGESFEAREDAIVANSEEELQPGVSESSSNSAIYSDLATIPSDEETGADEDEEPQAGPSSRKSIYEKEGTGEPGPSSERKSEDLPQTSSSDDEDHRIRSGPSGDNWVRDEKRLACPCGMMIARNRVSRHIKELCKIKPSPLARLKKHLRGLVSVKKMNSARVAQCPCGSVLKAGANDVSVARAMGRHISMKHRGLSKDEKSGLRREIFRGSHVLVATTTSIAIETGLPLEASSFENLEKTTAKHGTSHSQAMASSNTVAREEHVLRSSLQVNPGPQDLFLPGGLYAQSEPSYTSMNFLRRFERDLGIEMLDWRYLFGVVEHRRRAREVLNEKYSTSAELGYSTAQAVRKYVVFVIGHLAEIQGGTEWREIVTLFKDLVESVLKEHQHEVQNVRGKRELKHVTEQRLDYPTRKKIKTAVIKKLEEVKDEPLPEAAAERRSKAVWTRQALYVALSVDQASRTGDYQTLTVEELHKAVKTPHGLVITHVGGKNKKKFKTCQITATKRLHGLLKWYAEEMQPLLVKRGDDSQKKMLFPYLNVWDEHLMDLKIPEIGDIPYPKLLRGNSSRRSHVELAHALNDANMLEGTNVQELATLRCHSMATALKSYDARDKAVRAARATKALTSSANRLYRLDSESDESHQEEAGVENDDAGVQSVPQAEVEETEETWGQEALQAEVEETDDVCEQEICQGEVQEADGVEQYSLQVEVRDTDHDIPGSDVLSESSKSDRDMLLDDSPTKRLRFEDVFTDDSAEDNVEPPVQSTDATMEDRQEASQAEVEETDDVCEKEICQGEVQEADGVEQYSLQVEVRDTDHDIPGSDVPSESSNSDRDMFLDDSPTKRLRYEDVFTDDSAEDNVEPPVRSTDATMEDRQEALQAEVDETDDMCERSTDATMEDALRPFIRQLQEKPKLGHARTGTKWNEVEQATVLMALQQGVLEKRGTVPLDTRVELFLMERQNWDFAKRPVKAFRAMMYKMAKHN